MVPAHLTAVDPAGGGVAICGWLLVTKLVIVQNHFIYINVASLFSTFEKHFLNRDTQKRRVLDGVL